MNKLTNFNYNSEDRILEKALSHYYNYFSLKELFDGDEVITNKIKSLRIKDFLNLQRIILQEKTFITESGRSIPYVSVLDVFEYYNFLEYEKKNPGRYTRIAHSIKLIENLAVKFIELNSQLFNELINSEDLITKFYLENLEEIPNKEDFFIKARKKLEEIKDSWNEFSVQEIITLKKNFYNLKTELV